MGLDEELARLEKERHAASNRAQSQAAEQAAMSARCGQQIRSTLSRAADLLRSSSNPPITLLRTSLFKTNTVLGIGWALCKFPFVGSQGLIVTLDGRAYTPWGGEVGTQSAHRSREEDGGILTWDPYYRPVKRKRFGQNTGPTHQLVPDSQDERLVSLGVKPGYIALRPIEISTMPELVEEGKEWRRDKYTGELYEIGRGSDGRPYYPQFGVSRDGTPLILFGGDWNEGDGTRSLAVAENLHTWCAESIQFQRAIKGKQDSRPYFGTDYFDRR